MAFDHALTPPLSRFSFLNLLAGLRHDLFYSFLHRDTGDLVDLGDKTHACNWTIRTTGLNRDSIVYSAGVGRDISFEHALADQFGTKIILLDPSPTGLETMEMPEHQRKEFEFLPVALAGHEGELVLSPPGNAEEGSWITETSESINEHLSPDMVTVKCETVASLMKKYGHSHVDLLKIDIEGAEYGVLEAIMNSKVVVRQIAVEFHNGILPGISRSLTIRTLFKLYLHGYRIVHKTGSNHTLYLASEL